MTFKAPVKFDADMVRRMMASTAMEEKYGEVLAEVKLKELEIKTLPKGSFGLVIDGPFKGIKVKITGVRGQILPRTTQYVYEVRPWDINNVAHFNKIELAIPIEDLVAYTPANKLLYGT